MIFEDKMEEIKYKYLCGIYFIINNNCIEYIGKSINIMKRLGEHFYRKIANSNSKIYYIECKKE